MSLRQSSKSRLKLKICESQLQACGVAVQPFCIHTIQYSYHMISKEGIHYCSDKADRNKQAV
ncbi:hypothetical protein T12_15592, partial [Trichinella patagoniensis]